MRLLRPAVPGFTPQGEVRAHLTQGLGQPLSHRKCLGVAGTRPDQGRR